MKRTVASLSAVLLAAVCAAPLPAQRPGAQVAPGVPYGAPPPPRLPGQPGRQNSQAESGELLQRNYLILITVKQGEKSTDFSLLTASPSIRLSATGGGDNKTLVTMTGALSELEGGKLTFQYSIGARIPVVSEGVNGNRNIEYTNETGEGALHVTPGKAQSLMKADDRSYSVTITPVEENAGQ